MVSPAMHEGPGFSTSSPTLVPRHFVFCFEITIIMCAKQGLILVVMGLSSVTNDSEHLYMCLSATGTPSLEECLFKTLTVFEAGCLHFCA